MLDDVAHLGVLVPGAGSAQEGAPGLGGRIVALGTSAVFAEPDLVGRFWDVDAADLDNGLQAHMYTRHDDVLVVQVPAGHGDGAARRVEQALDAGAVAWRSLCGLELVPADGRVVLTGTRGSPRPPALAPTTRWVSGGMATAAAEAWRSTGAPLLAFVLDDALLARLQVDPTRSPGLARRAHVVTGLMDKNVAMRTLRTAGVPSPVTWTVDDGDTAGLLRAVEAHGRAAGGAARYVFKPAGGAAGVGVHGDRGGINVDALAEHVGALVREGVLPTRFQVQEYLPGVVLGVTVCVDGTGGHEVLEVHRALSDTTGRFVGATWTRADRDALAEGVRAVCTALAGAIDVPMLLGLDVVDGRVIEVNPRITAAAPIAHLLRRDAAIVRTAGIDRVDRIDLDARVLVSPAAIADGRVELAARTVRARYGALVLPQGVNPFGPSRVVAVNDAPDGRALRAFRGLVSG